MEFDLFDNVTLNDITDIFEKTGKGVQQITSLDGDPIITSDIADKLSSSCNIDISIPEVNIPKVDIPILRAA